MLNLRKNILTFLLLYDLLAQIGYNQDELNIFELVMKDLILSLNV